MNSSRRDFIRSVVAGGLTFAWPDRPGRGAPPVSGAARRKPNVILILTDDLGYGDLACHGNPVAKTPNLDALHDRSVRLTDFHVDPTCSPTRASLLTGRYSSRAGVWHTIMGRSILPTDEATMAETFARNGYRTGIFGKWHLGDNHPFRAHERGFQEAVVMGGGAIGNMPDYWGNEYTDDTYRHNGRWEKYSGYCTDVFFKAAMDFMAAAASGPGAPFFCYLPTNVVHWPHNVAEEYVKPYRGRVPDRRATLYGMLANLDENVGRLLRFLADSGLENDTILIFLSDNGTGFGAEFDASGFVKEGQNAGMRGDKGTVYEGGHRVPCFVRWPGGGIGGGRDISHLAAHLDLFPTLLALCGLERREGGAFDGASLAPLLRGEAAGWPERTLFVHNQRVDEPIKGKEWAAMTSRWRLIDGRELYDIREDPGQRRDVAAAHPEVVRDLVRDYDRWWDSISGRFKASVWIPLGADGENPVRLTSHDIHGQVCWDQSQARRNAKCDGYWTVEVARDATYEISVRRWPAEAGIPIREAPEGAKVFKPTHARLKIADFDATIPVGVKDAAAVFTVQLTRGRTRLQAWLIDDIENGETNGAFYVDVRTLRTGSSARS
jgi:arylsulfatase A-like enzyme